MSNKKEQRRGLGRGLSALMADVEPQISKTGEVEQVRPDRLVPIEKIVPNPDQPRRTFTPEQLEELADSIRVKGVIQPLIVRPDPRNSDQFEIVAGERRWRASQMAQLHELPVLVRDFDDIEVLEVAIIENIQRADLNAIEEAASYRQLMDKFGHTQEKMAEALGKSRSHIANLLRLLNLPEPVRDLVVAGDLSAGHARALITAEDPETLARKAVAKGMSVRAVEQMVKTAANPPAPRVRKKSEFEYDKDADTRALEADLAATLSMKVDIRHKPGQDAGSITISYETLEQLDALCGMLSTGR